jgi:ubiquinone biosynthesis protein
VLDPSLVPSPLVTAAETSEIQIVPVRDRERFETIRLVFAVVRLGLGLLWLKVTRRSTAEQRASRVRAFMEFHGGLWVKAGQLLSLRTDLFTTQMIDELSQLAYRAQGFPPEVARQVVERSMGAPVEKVFSYYEELPFAAASISQVHRARMRDSGMLVAIKVQRPGIERTLRRDLKLITAILRTMKRVPSVSYITWDGMIRELQEIVREEVDYRYEVANLRRLRKNLKDHGVYIPSVQRRLSGKQIIVMEYIDGVLMSDYLRVEQRDPARVHQWCKENDVRPRKVGSRLMRSFYRQLFEDRLFHSDLHPGNIVLLRESRFALLDLGAVGTIEKRLIAYYRMSAQAVSVGDYSKSIDYYLLQADSVPVLDIAAFKADAIERYRAWEAKTHLDGLTFHEKSVTGGLAAEISEISRKYKVNPSWQLLRVGRAMSTLDANLNTLLGKANPNKVLRRYFREYRKRSWRRVRVDGIASGLVGAIGEAGMTADFAAEQLRRGSVRVQGVQRKIDAVVQAVTSVIQVVFLVGLVIITYDQLHDHNLLPSWAHVDILDRLSAEISPYSTHWTILFILFGLYLIRQARKVNRRYKEPTQTLPDNRQVE